MDTVSTSSTVPSPDVQQQRSCAATSGSAAAVAAAAAAAEPPLQQQASFEVSKQENVNSMQGAVHHAGVSQLQAPAPAVETAHLSKDDENAVVQYMFATAQQPASLDFCSASHRTGAAAPWQGTLPLARFRVC